MMAPVSPLKFQAGLMPTLMAASSVRHETIADIEVVALGVGWPIITMAVAAIGVLAARLLSPRGKPSLTLGRALLVTLIMLIAAELWVLDTRPGLLFAFVVAIGLGYSGYSLIELMGDQVADYLKRVFAALPIPGRKIPPANAPQTDDPQEDDV